MSEITPGLWELLLKGGWITVQLTVFSAALSVLVAFAVGPARTHRSRLVRFAAGAYVEIFRGTSALILMFWIFFVLPMGFGWQLVPMWAAVLALGLTYGAYGAEVVRGALAAVEPGQLEAGIALGFTPGQRLRRVVLPQAWPEMIPPFGNLLVELLKGTALVSVMGVGDIAFGAALVRNATGDSAPVYTVVLLMYFVLAFTLTRGMRVLERRAKAGLGQDTGPSVADRFRARRRAAAPPPAPAAVTGAASASASASASAGGER
ncbi:ectoine/hydroxyectoine ABC transporter permease subunit EhuC [Streptomyces qinzhouensis]|uniref:Ectoine/hydroxyectoine ABC transporter permease subunit EhuC n=1 Tax=Streptomyces qinzhouensis TaxID=2599401 RepID=A0A5B8JAJ5_9ACTN|nr:ectoine/hydroxyectoine ABC transporter permease subunit EhuC [Streptomyces qinzhouensis]QDY76891.1 ectoine/hydroxyectoine ABC transporter permease subunit EhuC [Streptomyces qinzhouensis]